MFEKREVTRPADAEECADITKRLLDVLNSIDQTKEEAKAAASEFRGIIADLHTREIGLRFNLQTGTITQEIDVHPIADEATGMMQYFDHEGNEVVELRHELSQKQRDEAAQRRQLDMFGQDSSQDIKDLAEAFGNDEPGSDEATYESKETKTFNPADLDQLQEQAEANGQLPPKPDKKRGKKPESVEA